jgi:ribosome-associated toxin RatA of RatAB toxin-antitoxin module
MILRAALLLLWAVGAAAAQAVSVETSRRDAAVEVHAHALVEADYATVWATLTDYDHLGDFIPGMKRSRVVARRGPAAVIEQHGAAHFLFFSFPLDVTIESTARPPDAIDVRLVKGNLRRLEGGYRVRQLEAGRIELRWNGVVEPDTLPPLLGELVMRANIRDQFTGMVREIERREAERRRAAAAPRQ